MLDETSCARVRHKTYDRSMTHDTPSKQAMILKRVRVRVNDQQDISLSIHSDCLAQLSQRPDATLRISMKEYEWSEHNAATDAALPEEAECVKAPGTWFFLSDGGHGQVRLFGDTVAPDAVHLDECVWVGGVVELSACVGADESALLSALAPEARACLNYPLSCTSHHPAGQHR